MTERTAQARVRQRDSEGEGKEGEREFERQRMRSLFFLNIILYKSEPDTPAAFLTAIFI